MTLIYSRFAVDMFYALANMLNIYYLLFADIFPSIIVKNLAFFLAWPTFNFGTMRILLVFIITMDRLFASCLPIFYHRNRSKISNIIFIPIILSYTLFEHFVLFKICDFHLDIPMNCLQFKCSVGACYRSYWLYFEQNGYFIIGVLSLALCFRLFIWNSCTSSHQNREISKTTRICLLDAVITLTFDVIPSFVLTSFPSIDFQSIGPMTTTCKNFGFVIESMIICKVLLGKKPSVTVSVSRFSPS